MESLIKGLLAYFLGFVLRTSLSSSQKLTISVLMVTLFIGEEITVTQCRCVDVHLIIDGLCPTTKFFLCVMVLTSILRHE